MKSSIILNDTLNNDEKKKEIKQKKWRKKI